MQSIVNGINYALFFIENKEKERHVHSTHVSCLLPCVSASRRLVRQEIIFGGGMQFLFAGRRMGAPLLFSWFLVFITQTLTSQAPVQIACGARDGKAARSGFPWGAR